ncbi:Hypothetical predicted protein, partial [Paramuricea clavata]
MLETAKSLTDCPIVNLEILDLNEENLLALPKVFSRPSLPITRDSVQDQSD